MRSPPAVPLTSRVKVPLLRSPSTTLGPSPREGTEEEEKRGKLGQKRDTEKKRQGGIHETEGCPVVGLSGEFKLTPNLNTVISVIPYRVPYGMCQASCSRVIYTLVTVPRFGWEPSGTIFVSALR